MPNLLSGYDEENLESNGLKFAWTAKDLEGYVINDPKYLRWIVMIFDDTLERPKDIPLSFHACSKGEIRELAPPAPEA